MNGEYRNGQVLLYGTTKNVVDGKVIRKTCPCMRCRIWKGLDKQNLVVSFHDEDRGVHDLDVQFRAEYCGGLLDLLLCCIPKKRAEKVLAMHGYVSGDECMRLVENKKVDQP